MKLYLRALLLTFFCSPAFAQNPDPAAILKRIQTSRQDTNRVLDYIEPGQRRKILPESRCPERAAELRHWPVQVPLELYLHPQFAGKI